MKFRIAIWAGVGALVVVLWTLYISAGHPLGNVRTLAYLTCPIALAHHYALSFYFVLLVNAATYALVGTVVETVRRHYKQSRLISS
jgi:predicted cobalt transporter CbtA